MDDQDGISIRPMRLKVLYTFDDKTNCLARWPQVLDIQTAYLDEDTQIGVIELKTCIQAIVSASPELVANLGRDYTVYAYDYSEYETPLVGQGMLSWVLASASPTPNAPAHQSKTIVTGRVCRNALGGLLSRSAHEILEVKLRLVPVPTALQSEYLDSMQKYRDLSNVIPHDFDAQAWTSFLHANPGLMGNGNSNSASSQRVAEQGTGPVDRSGIDKLHELLSEASTPRDFSNPPPPPECMNADSPGTYMSRAPSRTSTPGINRPATQQQKRNSDDAFRPASRGSTQSLSLDTRQQTGRSTGRRDSVASGYGSGDERPDGPAQKRAKLVRPASAEKPNTNIERQTSEKQAGSLRVAASTAASVRIHRPTPLNPGAPPQPPGEEPVRPPTPIPSDLPAQGRRGRASQGSSLRRQSTVHSQFSNYSEDMAYDNHTAVTSPEDARGGNAADTPFNMPSSPPMMNNSYPPQTSSPILPPMPDHDSGFMSGNLESMLDDENCNLDGKNDTAEMQKKAHIAPKPNTVSGPGGRPASVSNQRQNLTSDNIIENASREAAPGLPPQPTSANGSRASSRASFRRPSKPLAPSRGSQGPGATAVADASRGRPPAGPIVPASDPVGQVNARHSQTESMDAPASELNSATPAPTQPDHSKARSGSVYGGRNKVQAKLDQCIKEGTVPPYCENCGTIETTTWRRAWSKVFEGNATAANSHLNDTGALFWETVDADENEVVTSFRLFKKSVLPDEKDFNMQLLCNPCGLWLNKTKSMRPEDKWNKAPPKDKRKRKSKRMRLLEAPGAATRSNARRLAMKGTESSPGPAEGSSPQGEDEESPEAETGPDEAGTEKPTANIVEAGAAAENGTGRANSAEPPTSPQKTRQLSDAEAMDALKRAIQSSPARNFETRQAQLSETQLTPKPVRRNLFGSPKSKDAEAMRTLSDAFINGMGRNPRSTPQKQANPAPEKENADPAASNDGMDDLFGTGENADDTLELPASPTPKRRSPRRLHPNNSGKDKDNNVPSPSPAEQQKQQPQLFRQESSGLSDSASRVNSNSNPNSTRSKPSSTSPQKDNQIETVDGLILNIFDCEDESGTQTSPNLFTPSKWPTVTDSWADWMASDHISPLGTRSTGQLRPDSGISGGSGDQFHKGLTGPAFLQGEINEASLHELFGGNQPDTMDSEMFGLDPNILDAWAKGADGEQGIGELDDASLAAIMQEVNNGDGNS